MKTNTTSARPISVYITILLTISFGCLGIAVVYPSTNSNSGPVLVPFLINAVRHPVEVSGQLLVYNREAPQSRIRLQALRLVSEGEVLVERKLAVELPGDPRYGQVSALIERLPRYFTRRHRPRAFASPDQAEFEHHELAERYYEIGESLAELKRDYTDARRRPFVQLKFELPLSKLFGRSSKPGDIATVVIAIDYLDRWNRAHTSSVTHRLRFLAPIPGIPQSLSDEIDGLSVHAGDLHVHSCHGEALDACEPSESCLAETLQISGSFTLAELKSQYQALGLDWYTATDHSYCINSEAEYQVIADETAAITDATFIVYPDTELSSDEEGPQTGIDLANLLCLGSTKMNHMGAHGISARKPGGNDDLLGFCDRLLSDVLESFVDNVEDILAEGGYAVINHPADLVFGWNSVDFTEGQEFNMFHGVEIWNGPFRSGQGDHVRRWTNWLLDGRILYAYSGSDTHDEAFAFGANHVILEGPFTPENLQSAIRAGRIYVSNAHFLVITLEGINETLLMGDVDTLPSRTRSGVAAEIVAHYDFAEDTAVITIFRGRVEEPEEVILCNSGPLAGSGAFACADTVNTSASSFYRAYSEDSSGSKTAYTNPIFLIVH